MEQILVDFELNILGDKVVLDVLYGGEEDTFGEANPVFYAEPNSSLIRVNGEEILLNDYYLKSVLLRRLESEVYDALDLSSYHKEDYDEEFKNWIEETEVESYPEPHELEA